MTVSERRCDICDWPEGELLPPGHEAGPSLEFDADGLSICADCRSRLTTSPAGEPDDAELPERLRQLVGQSAGAICYSLDLPYVPPNCSVIDAASLLAYDADHFMSAWSFVTQWLDGSTVWRSEGGRSMAIVGPDGSVTVRDR